MELQLIQLYLWVCLIYDKHPMLKYQRLSNNCQPNFTDQGAITVYLFGHFQGHFNQKRIYEHISQHFSDWFPDLPSYRAFDRQLNESGESLKILVFELMAQFADDNECFAEPDCVIDALTIMLAVRGRAAHAKVAGDDADVGLLREQGYLFSRGEDAHFGEKTRSVAAAAGNLDIEQSERTRFAGSARLGR